MKFRDISIYLKYREFPNILEKLIFDMNKINFMDYEIYLKLMENSRILIIFDGFDEINNNLKKKFEILFSSVNSNYKIILSSRSYDKYEYNKFSNKIKLMDLKRLKLNLT
jgi:hypothetical protein